MTEPRAITATRCTVCHRNAPVDDRTGVRLVAPHPSGSRECSGSGLAVDRRPPAPDLDVLREALEAASRQLATDPRDWALDRTDARLWAVLCGWDGEGDAMAEVAARHGWDDDYVRTLRRRRRAVARLLGEGS